ncbi:TPA: hypothetical protein ACNU9R_004206 [Citrobacter freundii]|uniref:hypothetical protein n=1 Tax=Citrobacter freundii TaxID=546 RepID=UPI001F120E85|nr:hypothetical protein [Citrobacter freundii]WBG09448.1 hypothetical protein O9240_09940 [Citrobacter freundii]
MTALNKQALNPAELESALLELKRISEQPAVSTHYARVLRKHIANLNCALEAAEKRIAELSASHSKLRDAMAAIHNTIRMDGGYTPLAAILNAAKRAHEESATAAGIGVKGE